MLAVEQAVDDQMPTAPSGGICRNATASYHHVGSSHGVARKAGQNRPDVYAAVSVIRRCPPLSGVARQ
jgi:hypothetical protein